MLVFLGENVGGAKGGGRRRGEAKVKRVCGGVVVLAELGHLSNGCSRVGGFELVRSRHSSGLKRDFERHLS